MKPVRTALVGYGLAGRVFHAPLIAHTRGMQVAAIVTGNDERAALAARDFPDAEIFASSEQLFGCADRFDLAIIASPTRFHASQAAAALKAGLAVVVDKPFATSSKDCQDLIALSRSTMRPLSVFQNRRWDNDFLTLKKLINDGTLKNVYRLESRFERYRPAVDAKKWRESSGIEDGGGLLFDLQSHLIDQACHLFGAPRQVYAEIDRRRSGATADDDTFVALQFEGGVRAHLWTNVISAARGHRFRLLALNGTYQKHHLDPQEDALRAGDNPSSAQWGIEPEERSGKLTIEREGVLSDITIKSEKGSYEQFYAQMRDAVLGEGTVPVAAQEALLTTRIIEMALASAGKGTALEFTSEALTSL